MLLQSPGTLQSHLFLLQIFHLQYPEQLQSKWLVFRNFLKNYPLNTWNQVLYSTWVICPWVSSCYCSIIYLLWVLNKKLCKMLFGHKNHHHLLNKYIWYNFFFAFSSNLICQEQPVRMLLNAEAVVQRRSIKKVFLEIS